MECPVELTSADVAFLADCFEEVASVFGLCASSRLRWANEVSGCGRSGKPFALHFCSHFIFLSNQGVKKVKRPQDGIPG